MTVFTLQLVICGRVQGVGFRAATARQARALGLSGWVRNRPDDSVEVWATARARAALVSLEKWVHHGPPMARVDGVQAIWGETESSETKTESGFNIKY